MDACCGSCLWFRPIAGALWAAPIPYGRCGYAPAPEALQRAPAMSANEGRACVVFVSAQAPGRGPASQR